MHDRGLYLVIHVLENTEYKLQGGKLRLATFFCIKTLIFTYLFLLFQ